MSKISDFNYIKYDCIEWMESREAKNYSSEVRRVVAKLSKTCACSPGHIVLRLCSRGIYHALQIGIFYIPFCCAFRPALLHIDKLTKIFYDFMIYTFKAVYLTFLRTFYTC